MKKQHALEVLYEDQWIIAINKPSGMLSVGYPGSSAKTAQDILFDMYRSKGKSRIAVVHRLDRDTSGVMLYARTEEAKKRFMDEWNEIVTERTYRCVCGKLPGAAPLPDSGVIDAPLAYNRYDVAFVPRKGDAKALKDAEKAVTRFRVLERGAKFDLVECELETGRKNQIRAHMAHLGHPVAGDEVYGKELIDASGGDAEGPCGRLALHARVIGFNHPFIHEQKRFEVAEPDSFKAAVVGKKRAATKAPVAAKPAGAKTPASAEKKTADVEKIPRRQRVKGSGLRKPGMESRKESELTRRERLAENDIANLTDLEPVRRQSKTKQPKGKSKFIPGQKK
ncbi:MAG TPA: RluA family pseudouridine synthase [Treponemataceae bacterium]|nr:RluA family pseudouridine synthase [Treponemataceae bacterium]